MMEEKHSLLIFVSIQEAHVLLLYVELKRNMRKTNGVKMKLTSPFNGDTCCNINVHLTNKVDGVKPKRVV